MGTFIIENSMLILIGVSLFSGVLLIIIGASFFLTERQFATHRLGISQEETSRIKRRENRISLEDDILAPIGKYLTPSNMKDLNAIRSRLIRAGYRAPSAVRIFYLSKAALAMFFVIITAITIPILTNISTALTAVIILVAFFLGYYLPSYWVERQIEYRKQAAELGFPDVLDMLLVCIEAGNSIDQASQRVAREIKHVSPILSEELTFANDELRAGKERQAVFRDFANRLGVPDISAFATVLRQSDEFGTSIADTLRVYAAEMRDKRVMRAEAKANLMPLQLALGTMFFTVPPVMIIMGGPSLLAILRAFSTMG